MLGKLSSIACIPCTNEYVFPKTCTVDPLNEVSEKVPFPHAIGALIVTVNEIGRAHV